MDLEALNNFEYARKYYWDRYTFLVVEDEIINAKFLDIILKRTGAKVIHAKDGREAIDKALNIQNIDFILMDIELPEINGYDAVLEIRKTKPKVKIIAQTAYAMQAQKAKCFEVGCDDYLAKPYSSDDLLELIASHLKTK